MGFLKKVWSKLRQPIKYSASDPDNFSEVWSFTSNRLRIVSLILVLLGLLLYASLYFLSPLFVSYQNSKGIKREKLEKQAKELAEMKQQLSEQERYIESLRLILLGEVPISSSIDSLKNYSTDKVDSLFQVKDSASITLEKNLREDMRTTRKSTRVALLLAPVNGVISQKFDGKTHKGLDVVTEANANVLSALAGTVIYAGYSRKDGYILILGHANNSITVYKHCKTVFKKVGDRVQLGDPIAIVGNSGENTSGPHLHFEVWLDNQAIDPEKMVTIRR